MHVSIGVFAWNEDGCIEATLRSLFEQDIFDRITEHGGRSEVIVVANGCTDRTVELACHVRIELLSGDTFAKRRTSMHVVDLKEKGKANAWNVFVHELSNKNADYLFMMDADILFIERQTMWSMLSTLDNNTFAQVATDTPIKDIELARSGSISRFVSIAGSRMTQSGSAQLTGQLYCIRAHKARNIRLPRGLLVEDGFIKTLVCTDFMTTDSDPRRIVRATDASHTFKGYITVKDVLNNQKRQKIAQTITHFLCDRLLPELSINERLQFAETVATKEAADCDWCVRRLRRYIESITWFGNIYPHALTFRFHQLTRLYGSDKLLYMPVAIIGFLVDLIACYRAHKSLRLQEINFWPDTFTKHGEDQN